MSALNFKKRLAGFTLVEVIIASAVFALFTGGLFSFYRMGSRMFMSGSWKLTRQKDGERFLMILKERIEQAANATSINPGAANQITSSACNFVTLKNGVSVSKITSNQRLMLFTVAKPDMTALPGAAKGVIVYHCLMAVPAEKNLYTLHLHANTQAVAYDGIDYFNSTANFKPDTTVFPNFAAKFSNLPANFGLGSVPYTYKLNDVASLTISWALADPDAPGGETDKVVGLRLTMQNPGHPETSVDQGIQAKLDMAVTLDPKDLGGF